MQNLNSPLVSIIIPCYNASKFIAETINSVLSQSYKQIELIVIDDGSTDDSFEILQEIEEKEGRLKLVSQENQGVSIARNIGFDLAVGEFVVFFDADDLMSVDFIESRISKIRNKHQLDFCCGEVFHFSNSINHIIDRSKGIYEDISEILLLYSKGYASCPSNYLFRKSSLINHRIQFNSRLASTADRFYLLEVDNYNLIGHRVENTGQLYYRVHSNSMSNLMTVKLLDDNIQFYHEIQKEHLIPKRINKEAVTKGYFILALASFKLYLLSKGIKWSVKSFIVSPYLFVNLILKRLR